LTQIGIFGLKIYHLATLLSFGRKVFEQIVWVFCKSGLPDGIFSNRKSQFGEILLDPALEDVSLFYGYFVCFTAMRYILWPFGIFYGYLVYFSLFGMLYQEKTGRTAVCKYGRKFI
jgi:hypothetical protein